MIQRQAFFAGLLILTSIIPGIDASAGPNDPPAVPDRFLLVLDVSSPMRAREEAIKSSIEELLVSGMQGEIHNGDQLGLWTFNNELHTGDFELLIWDESTRDEIIGAVLQFIDKVRFRKSTDFSKVTSHLMDVVADSKRITVILVSDGDEVIEGTPFDEAITAYFNENMDAMKDSRQPILTVMRGYEGELFGHTLSYPPWPIVFPEFPPEPEPELEPEPARPTSVRAQSDLSRTVVTTNKGPIVFAEPLIVRGPSRDAAPPPPRPLNETNGSATATNLNSTASTLATNEAPVAVGADSQSGVVEAGDFSEDSSNGPDRSKAYRIVTLVGGVAVLVAIGAGIALMRRPRAKRRVSLITQSMDKKGGPR